MSAAKPIHKQAQDLNMSSRWLLNFIHMSESTINLSKLHPLSIENLLCTK